MAHLNFKKITPADKEYADVFELREEILRKPIGLSLHDEDLSDEVNDHILIAEDNDEIIACLILSPRPGNTVQLRQMAVAVKHQGRSIGKQLVNYAEQFAREHGYERIMLHARMVAKGFYERLGYLQTGDEFTEVGIPHIQMEKRTG
ncbi:MAG: GNAT family N-acetyltransferase [Chitinophagaceae bacterium]|nr:GNAT family N-acetyltransferase [Chitinophagaceae bacterium]MCB9044837.1 GNAT family N-acetyltransferase [Chitinophagales bacterium]